MTFISHYGEIPNDSVENYIKILINKTYKILPMKEEELPTLKSYIESYLRELIGAHIFLFNEDNKQLMVLISTMTYLANSEYDVSVCRKEVFKCIHILQDISNSLNNKE